MMYDHVTGAPASTLLTREHHAMIVSYLTDLSKQEVVNVGVKLGLSYTSLDASSNFPDDMVTRWLRKDCNVLQVGKPSWDILISALQSCDHNGIASSIRKGELPIFFNMCLSLGFKSMQIRRFDSPVYL